MGRISYNSKANNLHVVAKSSDFNKYVESMLSDYKDEIEENMDLILKETGKETVKELKKTSPKRRGAYGRNWKYKIVSTRFGKTLYVYNRIYQLTHLLEHGHAKLNGGRTKAQPHILPAQNKAISNILKKLESKLRG